MQKFDSHKYLQEQKSFKLLWTFVSLIILALLLGYNWQHNQKTAEQTLQIRVQNIQDSVEELLDNLLQSIYSLPIYGKHFIDCQTKLQSILQQAVFNNANVSGLLISDSKNKILCSTLPPSYSLTEPRDAARTLSGPLTIDKKHQAFFTLQQRLGDYQVTLYFLEKILQEKLKPFLAPNNYIIIYNEQDKKSILSVTNPQNDSPETFKGPFARTKLQALDNISVIVGTNPSQIAQSFLISSFIISFILLGSSILLYLVTKQLMNKRFSLQGHLKYAIKNKHFFPVYQPVYNAELERFHGAEVLLRWKTPDNEIILPSAFIAEAEKTECILDITLQIADIALTDYSRYLRQKQPFYLAFNVSALHFINENFFPQFIEIIKKHRIKPQQIMFELTERDIINKNDHAFSQIMQQLREQGFSLAIDDFGTGHANISYLQHFPFNYLKIDQLFVHAIGTGSVTELLIDTIISMAKSLNLTIIAEGIEESYQAEYLKANDVKNLQGWYYAKSMTITELRQIL